MLYPSPPPSNEQRYPVTVPASAYTNYEAYTNQQTTATYSSDSQSQSHSCNQQQVGAGSLIQNYQEVANSSNSGANLEMHKTLAYYMQMKILQGRNIHVSVLETYCL